MANNQYVNKVVYGNDTVIDLTSDTVSADKVVRGYTAHNASGAPITGTYDLPVYQEKTVTPTSSVQIIEPDPPESITLLNYSSTQETLSYTITRDITWDSAPVVGNTYHLTFEIRRETTGDALYIYTYDSDVVWSGYGQTFTASDSETAVQVDLTLNETTAVVTRHASTSTTQFYYSIRSIVFSGTSRGYDALSRVTVNAASGSASLQTKSVTYSPASTQAVYTVLPDSGYDGMSQVTVTVNAEAANFVQGTFTTGSTRNTTETFTIPYTGSGYPIAMTIVVAGGAYNNSSTGDTEWYNSVNRYDVGAYYMTKARITTSPTYSTSGADNYGVVAVIYKNSTSNSATYSRTSSMSVNEFTTASGANSTACARFKGTGGTTVSYYIGNQGSSAIGFAPETEYQYFVVYSS